MTPLHQAVIEGNEPLVEALALSEEMKRSVDPLGFTPLELAQFLGKKRCMKLLGYRYPRSIQVQYKEEPLSILVPLEAFESDFDLHYRPFLYFPNYAALEKSVRNCPYVLRNRWLVKDNYEWTERYRPQFSQGYVAALSVGWVDEVLGYGAFAEEDIAQGEYVGEYTGLVRRVSRFRAELNGYCFHYPTRFWSFHYYVVDAVHEGNEISFVNHSDKPNLQPLCLVDRGLLHLVLVAKRDIAKGEQLFFNYGEDYWRTRVKVDRPS